MYGTIFLTVEVESFGSDRERVHVRPECATNFVLLQYKPYEFITGHFFSWRRTEDASLVFVHECAPVGGVIQLERFNLRQILGSGRFSLVSGGSRGSCLEWAESEEATLG